jgi:hypothetical protein
MESLTTNGLDESLLMNLNKPFRNRHLCSRTTTRCEESLPFCLKTNEPAKPAR